ncbi:MAG: heme-copper oxidase subunit III [Planctomycetes bacterium]|nr:heme-copper oxidase subunit III [Planctomycetota bacterium]
MYNGKFGIWLFLASEVMLFGALFSTYVLLRVGAPPGSWPIYGAPSIHGHEILSIPMATFNTAVLIGSSVTMVLAWAALKIGNLSRGKLYLLITFALAGTFLVVKYFEYKAKFTHYLVVLKDAPPDELKDVVDHRPIQTGAVTRDLWFVNGHMTEDDKEKDYIKIVPDPKKAAHGEGDAGHAPAAASHGGDGHNHAPVQIERSLIQRYSYWGPQASTFLGIYFCITGLHGLHILGGMIVIIYMYFTADGWWKRNPEKIINRVECTGLYWHFVDLVWIFLFPILYLL